MAENKFTPKVEQKDLGDGKSLNIIDHRAYLDPSDGLERDNESKEGGVESYDMVDAKGKVAFHVTDKLAYLKDESEAESAKVGSNPDASNEDVRLAQESEKETIINADAKGKDATDALALYDQYDNPIIKDQEIAIPERVEPSEEIKTETKSKVVESSTKRPTEEIKDLEKPVIGDVTGDVKMTKTPEVIKEENPRKELDVSPSQLVEKFLILSGLIDKYEDFPILSLSSQQQEEASYELREMAKRYFETDRRSREEQSEKINDYKKEISALHTKYFGTSKEEISESETISTPESVSIDSHYEKSIDDGDPFSRLNDLKAELVSKEKELLDLADANEDSMMFKGLFKPRAIKKMLKRMREDLAEDIQRLKKEIEAELARIEFKKVLTQLHIDLENAKASLEKARMSAKPMETAFYENEIKKLEQEINEIEKLLDGGIVNKIKSAWESFKNSNRWGFIKERAKGLLTFGYWEFHQAEKFRSGTNKVAQSIDRQTTEQEALVDEEARQADKTKGTEAHRLGLYSALKEAGEIKKTLDIAGNNNPDASQYEELSQQISNRKREENDLLINGITERAINDIIQRLETSSKLQGYRTAHEGKSVIIPERLEMIRQKIKESLDGLRFKQEVDDIKTYKAMIRENLDPKWWTRYIYGGLETILGSVALKLILTPTPAGPPMGVGYTTTVPPKIDGGITDAYLKDTVWGEAKRFLASHGISSPSNAQILEASKTISSESGVIVPEWGIKGAILHTKMHAGYLLKMGGVLKKLAMIKAII